MPKQITQAELRSVLEHYNAAAEAALTIRQRISTEGAEVEPGRYSVETDGNTDPNADCLSNGLSLDGLDISPCEKEAPEWLNETPEEIEYSLEVTDFDAAHDQQLQKVLVTRVEYIALKTQLAKMRGYEALEVAHA